MSQCTSHHDVYGVQCTAGKFHRPHMLHIWQGWLKPEDEVRTTVLWNDEESREHMTLEREFFALAEDMIANKRYAVPQYQTMIADLLIRLRLKEKNK